MSWLCEQPAPPGSVLQSRAVWLLPSGLFLLLGIAALPHDLAFARWFAAGNLPGGIGDLLERAETFAHGIGIAGILLALFVIDRSRRWTYPRVILAVLAAGMGANLIKLSVARSRPHSTDLSGSLADTFGGLFPLFSGGSTAQSTPSSHTAAAVAFALALCWLFPRGRWVFATLAVLAASQRLAGGAHYLSDVFWGAAVGWFLGQGILCGFLTGSRFDRFEATLRPLSRGWLGSDVAIDDEQPERHPRAA